MDNTETFRYIFFQHLSSMKIAIGTTRKPKIDGVKKAIETCPYFQNIEDEIEYITKDVLSNVSKMPMTLDEIMLGAKNRAKNLFEAGVVADFFVGIEGGVEKFGEKAYLLGCVYIESAKGEGHYGFSPMMEVPEIVWRRMYDKGEELGPIMENLSGGRDVRSENGSMGMWTDDMLVRRDEFVFAFYSAIAPFFNEYYRMQ